jgi:hypothetical protein
MYKLNEDLLTTINPESAYLGGWGLTDGFYDKQLAKFILQLNEKDRGVLRYLRDTFSPESKIASYTRKQLRSDGTPSVEVKFLISRRGVVDKFVDNYGIHEKKSFTCRWPQNLPDNLVPVFLRAVFEGDGSITGGIKKDLKKGVTWKICGSSKGMLEDIADIVSKYIGLQKKELYIVTGGLYTRPHYILYYTSIDEIHKIYDFMYKDATVCLLRKYKKFHEIFDAYGNEYVIYTDYDIPNKV